MVLTVAEGKQQHVAYLNGAGRGRQPRLSCMVQPLADRQIAQCITGRSEGLRTGCQKRGGHNADTVEPGLWIAAMQAEGDAN